MNRTVPSLLLGLLSWTTVPAAELAYAVDHYGVHGVYEREADARGGYRLGRPVVTIELYIRKRQQDWPEIETQTIGHSWTRRPSVLQDGPGFRYLGRAGWRPVELILAETSDGIDADYRFGARPTDPADPYTSLRERGLVVSVHRPELVSAGATAGGLACIRVDGGPGPIEITAPIAAGGRISHIAPELFTDADKGIRIGQPGKHYIPADLGTTDGGIPLHCRIRLPEAIPRLLANRDSTRRHDQRTWDHPPFDHRTLPFDVSGLLLDPPAGKHGRVTVRDGHLVFSGDGRRFLIHGTTLAHGAKFPTHAEADAMAARIAGLGFNLVRLHHLDSHLPAIGLYDQRSWREDAEPHLDAERLERMDYLVSQLRRRGVYIHLDGISQRRFGPGEAIPEAERLTSGLKATAFLDWEPVRRKQRDQLAAFWTHRNPYTGLAYAEDPAIATGEINNENDLLTHGPNNVPPAWRTILDRNRSNAPAPAPAEDPWLSFAAGTMTSYFDGFHTFLRSIGVQAPLCGTNWIKPDERMGLLLAHGGMDFTADHPYPQTLAPAVIGGAPMPAVPEHPFILSLAKIAGKPVIHNEWGVRTPDRTLLIVLQMALTAILDHDGSMQFAYMHHFAPHTPGNGDLLSFNLASDPAQWVVMPALNLMYARGDLGRLSKERIMPLDRSLLLGPRGSGLLGSDLRSRLPGIERLALTERLAFTIGATDRAWPEPPVPGQVASIGALTIDAAAGTLVVCSPRTCIASGRIGGREIDFGDGVALRVRTGTADGYATVILTSLDDRPIRESKRILVTRVGHVEPPDAVFDQDWLNPAYQGSTVLTSPVDIELSLPGSRYGLASCQPVPAGEPTRLQTETGSHPPLALGGPAPLWILTRDTVP